MISRPGTFVLLEVAGSLCVNSKFCRSKDLATQNSLLHQHLESVTTQAAKIRQAADTETSGSSDVDTSGDADGKLSELRSVVSYLRKEKEIVDLQLELSKQENVRFKTQIEHLTRSLEESRKALTEVGTS